MTKKDVKKILVLCACSSKNAIANPPKEFKHLQGLCFRCLCKLKGVSEA